MRRLKHSGMRDFKNDAHALQVLHARHVFEQRNGILVGFWDELDQDAKDAVQYLCDEWDFTWIEKERP